MAELSDDDLIALATKNGIAVPDTEPSDEELIALAKQKGIDVPMKSFSEVDWLSAIGDEITKPLPPEASAMVDSSKVLMSSAPTQTAEAAAAGLIKQAPNALAAGKYAGKKALGLLKYAGKQGLRAAGLGGAGAAAGYGLIQALKQH